MATPLKTQAATEIARFLANHPTPEQIMAFHPSFEVAERAYELIHTERDSSLTENVHLFVTHDLGWESLEMEAALAATRIDYRFDPEAALAFLDVCS